MSVIICKQGNGSSYSWVPAAHMKQKISTITLDRLDLMTSSGMTEIMGLTTIDMSLMTRDMGLMTSNDTVKVLDAPH